jgi:exopolysaccharide biosynthesis WecB/TagA/CpsF family protein
MLSVPTVQSIATSIRAVDGDSTALLDEMLSERTYVVSFVNAHAVNLACKSPEFFTALMRANALLRDGFGVKILMRVLGKKPGNNMNGTDFIPRILAASRFKSVALYGSTPEIAEGAATALRNSGAAGVTHCDGFQSLDYYLQRVLADHPRVVVLGMGMPKQELVADAIIKAAAGPILIINGGAILDFFSGRFKRAPIWMRNIGMEWLYRLWCEPRRLWRRYLLGNFVFLARVALAGFQNRFTEERPITS